VGANGIWYVCRGAEVLNSLRCLTERKPDCPARRQAEEPEIIPRLALFVRCTEGRFARSVRFAPGAIDRTGRPPSDLLAHGSCEILLLAGRQPDLKFRLLVR